MAITIILLLLLILFIIAPWLSALAVAKWSNALMISGIFSLLLIPLTLLILNQNQLVLGEQSEIISWSKKLSGKKSPAGWAKDNFIFIDASYSNELVPLPGSNKLGNSTLAITDRNELARLFKLLSEQDSFSDMIICDIYMDITSEADSTLRYIITEPVIEKKLVMADNFLHPNTAGFASLSDSTYGGIVEHGAGESNQFATYIPVMDKRISIAYQSYRRLEKISTRPLLFQSLLQETGPGGHRQTGLNSYIPDFALPEEAELYHPMAEEKEQEGSASSYNYFELGDLGAAASQALFRNVLAQRKKEGLKNIVFIGSFKGPDSDIHETYFGKLHGSTIILNLLYSLVSGQHLLTFVYFFYLWVGITAILYVLIRISFEQPLFGKKKKVTEHHHSVNPLVSFFQSVWHVVFIHYAHTWLLALFAFLTYIVWGRIINCFALIILLHVIAGVFIYYRKHPKLK